MRQAAVLALVLALAFGRDLLAAVGGSGASAGERAPPQALDVDAGRSAGLRVHIAYCTS